MTLSFTDFDLNPKVLLGINKAGFVQPSPIQQAAIPAILGGKDVVALAQTGSGKTAAFILPILSRLKFSGNIEVLVLVPTRELAEQVSNDFEKLGGPLGVRTVVVVGGKSLENQAYQANNGRQVIVATPGRLIDHLSAKRLRKFDPSVVVLDEADEMLDMGFIDAIKEINEYLPKERQTLLFSATMSDGVRRLAKDLLTEPLSINLTNKDVKHEDIDQRLYVVRDSEREDALIRLIEAENPEKALIFCRTKLATDQLCESLLKRKIQVKAIHGDLPQTTRMAAMNSLKNGNIRFLVATDVAARGLDISDLSHVFNYHIPDNKDRYTHRIGRTGRAGKKGIAITIASPHELRSHDFFRHSKIAEFGIHPIPTRKELESRKDQDLITRIESTDIEHAVPDVCRSFYYTDEGFDFVCRMFSYLKGLNPVGGPDKFGLSAEEVLGLLKKKKSSGAKFGGGYRGRGGDYYRSKESGRGRDFGRGSKKRFGNGSPFKARQEQHP
jgi:ATP-dependent RNA helicase DeaD